MVFQLIPRTQEWIYGVIRGIPVYGLGVEGERGRGRPHRGWIDELVSALSVRGLTVELARATVHDGPVWKRLINLSVKRWLSEWHGTEVQTREYGVIYDGCL